MRLRVQPHGAAAARLAPIAQLRALGGHWRFLEGTFQTPFQRALISKCVCSLTLLRSLTGCIRHPHVLLRTLFACQARLQPCQQWIWGSERQRWEESEGR
jgi:hypothetical protein